MTSSLIDHLVEYRGIESHYTDAWGRPATIASDTKKKLLQAMGYQLDDESKLVQQIDDAVKEMWLSPLDPVQVLRVDDSLQIALRLPIELVSDEYTCQITNEQGEVLEHSLTPTDGQLINIVHIDEVEFQEYLMEIPLSLPLGYHALA
ncbi:MAG: 4-alpha-glucanotransferase, partial [Paraglaciecola sp.]